MPHKRNRRLKDHKMLQEIAKENPDIFEDNLIDTYYPQRPINLEALCLYDFVANYDWYGKDDSGNRKYKKLTKYRLPNHKLFDPEKDYYYSLNFFKMNLPKKLFIAFYQLMLIALHTMINYRKC